MRADLWVAIDFETATNDPSSACALGLAVIDGLHVVEARSWLIQPPANEYHWYCTRVHGLTEDDTSHSPEFGELWPELQQYLADGKLLAHNASFDSRVLASLALRHSLDLGDAAFACTVTMSRSAFPALSNHKLPTVCDACGIDLVHHEAASDALACARVALACAEQVGLSGIDETVDALGVAMRPV